MLAGIYDPGGVGGGEGEHARRRLEKVFGARPGTEALSAGGLCVIADPGAFATVQPGLGCALEGSVYNLDEIARDLSESLEQGAAAIVARAFGHWGEEMLLRLRGGFALVAWDQRTGRVLLAQDQVGIGALFLHSAGARLSFAAELHHLVRVLPGTPSPDETGVARWILLAGQDDGLTIYRGVRRLGAGRCVAVDATGRVHHRRYWTPSYRPPIEGSRLEVAARVRDALIGTVARRTRDAQSVGLTLSGGFDSSAVAAATVRAGSGPLRGYCTVFPDEAGMDDRDLLDSLAEELGIEQVRYQVQPGGAVEVALEYLRDWELPLSGPGWVTELPLLREAAAAGVQVMLDGQGGDEIFGIAPFLVADRLRAGRLLSAVGLIRHGFPGAGAGAPWPSTLRLLRQFGLRAAGGHRAYRLVRLVKRPERNPPAILNSTGIAALLRADDELRWMTSGEGPCWWRHLRHVLVEDREANGLGDFIRQRAAWVGFEARPPLFDVELIETALRIAPEFRFDPYLDRPIAREALAGVLPDPVRLARRKSNLAPFYHRGLTGPDLPMIRRILGDGRLEIHRWVRADHLRGLLDAPPAAGTPGWAHWISTIWGCLSAECWLRWLADDTFVERMLAAQELVPLRYRRIP